MNKFHLALAALGVAALAAATPAEAGACHPVKVNGEWRCVQAHNPYHHVKRAQVRRHYHAQQHYQPRYRAPRYNYAQQPQYYAPQQQYYVQQQAVSQPYAYAVTTYYYTQQQQYVYQQPQYTYQPQYYAPQQYTYAQPQQQYYGLKLRSSLSIGFEKQHYQHQHYHHQHYQHQHYQHHHNWQHKHQHQDVIYSRH
jgi:hypothetical protein